MRLSHCVTIILMLIVKVNVFSSSDEIYSKTSVSNTLYLGIDNILSVSPSILSDSSYFITTNNGKLFTDSSFLTIIPRRLPVAEVSIYKKNESDTSLYSSKRFRVKYIPKPHVMIGNEKIKNNSVIYRDTILNTSGLHIYFSDDIIGSENWFNINRFSIGYGNGAVYKSIVAYDHMFTNEMKMFIENLHPGQHINLKVKIESKENIIKNLPIYSIRIL